MRYRKKGGVLFAVMSVVLLCAMIYFSVNPFFGVLVSVPTFMAAEQLLQAYNQFCVTYAQKGTYSNGTEFRVFATVDNMKDRLLDRTKARKINRQSFGIGVVSAVVSVGILLVR